MDKAKADRIEMEFKRDNVICPKCCGAVPKWKLGWPVVTDPKPQGKAGPMEALENLLFDLCKAGQLASDDFGLRRMVSRAMPKVFEAARVTHQ